MASSLERTAAIVGSLLPIAVHAPDKLPAVVGGLTRVQANAATVLLVLFDRKRQGRVRFDVDLPELDELGEAAARGPAAILEVVRGLDDDDVREALVNLLILHRDLTIREVAARASAALN